MASTKVADYVAKCVCGAVKVKVAGPVVSNHFCHCRACGRARAMTPVHLLIVKGTPEILEGAEYVKTVNGMGKLCHTSCTKCLTGVYQGPEGAPFFAAFPSTFHIEQPNGDEPPITVLPEELMPTSHCNYENRLTNFYDSIPKYKTFPAWRGGEGAGVEMTNDGKVIS